MRGKEAKQNVRRIQVGGDESNRGRDIDREYVRTSVWDFFFHHGCRSFLLLVFRFLFPLPAVFFSVPTSEGVWGVDQKIIVSRTYFFVTVGIVSFRFPCSFLSNAFSFFSFPPRKPEGKEWVSG